MFNNVEFKANQLLDMAECDNLPIDVCEIASRCGYNIRNYSTCKSLIKKLSAEDIIKKYSSISFLYDGAYYILLSDDLTKNQETKLIAHEIGHIQLHNLDGYDISRLHEDTDTTEIQESEANEFALHLLAPLTLLNRHKIKGPSDIKELTGLSLNDCRVVFEKLRKYRDEACVINSRNRLLERYINVTQAKHTPKRIVIAVLCVVTLMFGTFATLNGSAAKSTNQDTCVNIVADTIDISSCAGIVQQYDVSSTVPYNYRNQSETSFLHSQIDVPCASANAGVSEDNRRIILSNSAVYYWTGSGTVFHLYRNCQSLKNSSEIHHGSLAIAQDKKRRLCKFCEDKKH